MSDRARHEKQIDLLSTTFGGEFSRALRRLIQREPGLGFFTDEQVAQLRAEMIEAEWSRHQIVRRNRKLRAA